jgi:Na+/phosphate symporter
MTHALEFIVLPSFTHVENNHKPLLDKQIIVLTLISETIDVMEKIIIETIEKEDFENKEENIRNLQIDLLGYINEARKVHLKRIKNNEVSTKNSMLYLNLLSETKNIALYMINAYKSHRDFVKDYNMSLKQ